MPDFNVTIIALPNQGGALITDIEYRVNGGAAVSTGGTTSFQILGVPSLSDTVQIRAVNAFGAGPWSIAKSPAAWTVALTGLTGGEARQGATIGLDIQPALGGETVTYQWTANGVPIGGATSNTFTVNIGTNVTDADTLRCEVTIDGDTFLSDVAPARYAPGSVVESALADWIIDDDVLDVNLAADFTIPNLTGTFVIAGLPAGTADDGDGTISGTATGTPAPVSLTCTFTDQYGRTVVGSYALDTVYRTQAVGGADLDLSFEEDIAIASTNLVQNWSANGNTLTLVSVAPTLPAGLSVSSAGVLTGTPTTPTADATYTLTMQDEYSRQTSDTFTLEITETSATATATLTASKTTILPGETINIDIADYGFTVPDERKVTVLYDMDDAGSVFSTGSGMDANQRVCQFTNKAWATPGTKNVSCQIWDETNTLAAIGNITITVEDPDLVSWDRDYVVNDTSSWNDVVPAGAGERVRVTIQDDTTISVSTTMAPNGADGETYVVASFDGTNRPVMTSAAERNIFRPNRNAANLNFVIWGIHGAGTYQQKTGDGVVVSLISAGQASSGIYSKISVFQCAMNGGNLIAFGGGDQTYGGSEVAVSDVYCRDWKDYAMSRFGEWADISLTGADFRSDPLNIRYTTAKTSPPDTADHNVRFGCCRYGSCEASIIMSNVGWSVIVDDWAANPSLRMHPTTHSEVSRFFVRRNIFANIWQTVAIGDVSSTVVMNTSPEIACVDMNWHIIGWQSRFPINIACSPFSFQNNLVYLANVDNASWALNNALRLEVPDQATLVDNGDALIAFNHFISDRAGTFADVVNDWGGTPTVTKTGNVIYCPNASNSGSFTDFAPFSRGDHFALVNEPAGAGVSAGHESISSGYIPHFDINMVVRGNPTNAGCFDGSVSTVQNVAAPVNSTPPPAPTELAAFPDVWSLSSHGNWTFGPDIWDPYLVEYQWRESGTPVVNSAGDPVHVRSVLDNSGALVAGDAGFYTMTAVDVVLTATNMSGQKTDATSGTVGAPPTFINDAFRLYDDDVSGGIAAQTALAAVDTNWTQDADVVFHAAMLVTETAGGTGSITPQLQFKLNNRAWADVDVDTPVLLATPANCNTANGASYGTTALTTGATIQATEYCTDGTAGAVLLSSSSYEITFPLKIVKEQVIDGDTIQLRIINNGAVITDTTIPTITVNDLETTGYSVSINPADYSNLIENVTYTSLLNIDGSGSDTLYRNCTFRDHGGNGVDIRDVTDITFYNCRFENLEGVGVRMRSTGNSDRISVIQCAFANVAENGVSSTQRRWSVTPPINHDNVTVEGCYFEDVSYFSSGHHMLYLQGTEFVVKDNEFRGDFGGNVISVRSSGTITGNLIHKLTSTKDSTPAGIKYYSDHTTGPSKKLTITGNTVDGGSILDWCLQVRRVEGTVEWNAFGGAEEDFHINTLEWHSNTLSNWLVAAQVIDEAGSETPYTSESWFTVDTTP